MKHSIFIFILSLSSISLVSAQRDQQALEVLDAMSNKYRKMKGFTSKFTYRLENPSENINDSFDGSISISGEKYFLDLGSQQIINNGETMWTYLPEAQEVNISDYEPEEETLSLNNIFDVYKEGYKYIMNVDFTNANINAVDLIPDDKESEFFKIRMFIDARSYVLKEFMIFEKSGNRYSYRINVFSEKDAFAPGTFSFDPSTHPEVEVIDFR